MPVRAVWLALEFGKTGAGKRWRCGSASARGRDSGSWVLNQLRNRDTAVVSGLKGCSEALEAASPKAVVQNLHRVPAAPFAESCALQGKEETLGSAEEDGMDPRPIRTIRGLAHDRTTHLRN